MKVTPNPSLKSLNTFGLDASAKALIAVESEEDILALPGFDPTVDLVLGGGSNVVFLSDVPGTVILNRIPGIEIVKEAGDTVIVDAGAGENWQKLVHWSLQQGLNGLENLSLIPGSVGAAPIQNIGAYGVELGSVLDSVTAWDWKTSCWAVLGREQCRFGYRDSVFKTGEPDRFLISSVRFTLSRRFDPQLGYPGLQQEIKKAAVENLDALSVSAAVTRLRNRKLPNPELSGNAGSFFKNPIVDAATAEELRIRHDGLPAWSQPNGDVKLSAAWMIEACGLKGLSEGGACVSEQHALVLVNAGGASGHDVSALTIEIQKAVFESFGMRLETEPKLIEFPRL